MIHSFEYKFDKACAKCSINVNPTLKKKRNIMSTTFSEQILGGKLLLILIYNTMLKLLLSISFSQ